MTFRYSLDASFRNAILEQNENRSKMKKANGAIWTEFGSRKLEKKVSTHS